MLQRPWIMKACRAFSGQRLAKKEIKMFRSVGKLRTLLDNWFDVIAVAMGILTLVFVMIQAALGAAPPQKTFPSPEEAVRALIDASRGKETKPILEILGPEAKGLSRNRRSGFRSRESREFR